MIDNSTLSILVLLLSAKQPIYQNDQKAQKISWISKAPKNVRVFHLLGELDAPNRLVGDSLFVNCKDEAILLKTILGLKYCLDNFSFDFIVRSNTSTFFDTSLLEPKLKGKPNKGFGGFWDLYGTNREPFVTGTGMFLSRYAAETLINEFTKSDDDSIPDDVAISRILLRNKEIEGFSITRKSLSASHFVTSHFYVRCKDSDNPLNTSIRIERYGEFYFSKGIDKLFLLLKLQLWELSFISLRTKAISNYISILVQLILQFLRNRQIPKLINGFSKSRPLSDLS